MGFAIAFVIVIFDMFCTLLYLLLLDVSSLISKISSSDAFERFLLADANTVYAAAKPMIVPNMVFVLLLII